MLICAGKSMLKVSEMRQDWSNYSTSFLIELLDKSNNSIERCDLICELVDREQRKGTIRNSSVKKILDRLSESDQVFWNNYLVSDFANAAKDILGFEKYSGDRQETRGLIEVKLNF